MISARLCGGLGNQLFQIFTTIAFAFKYSKPFFFLNYFDLKTGRHPYWNTFLSALKPFLKEINTLPPIHYFKEQSFTYEPIDNEYPRGTAQVLIGYFQSPKYFDEYKRFIYKLLKIEEKKELVKTKLTNIVSLNNDTINISIHFRFGDYKLYPEIYNILDETYYKNALKYILHFVETNKPINLLYFVEESSKNEANQIIDLLHTEYPFINIIYINDDFDDWEQLLVMSLCNHNIIANSTFSWWGAYLNANNNAITCCPQKWFATKCDKDIRDLYLRTWKII